MLPPVEFCFDCGKSLPTVVNGAAGYGRNPEGQKICYKCCANRDKEEMRTTGKIVLYLSGVPSRGQSKGYSLSTDWKITNWPGSLQFAPLGMVKIGHHNIGGLRADVWFVFEGWVWHGVRIGNNTEILHCKRTKQPNPSQPQPRKHYIGIAGLHGYMPNYNTCAYDTRGQCADDLGSLHELSGRAIKQMRRDQYFELDLHTHGNEYCEITECDCGGNSDTCPANDPM